ncbi:MAG: IS110 family transposase [Ruminococcus sp.]|nr:IS110 family transposase [Ruminococcus sp.]
MNAVGIDVSKGKSTVAVLRPFGEVVASPFDVAHTGSELKSLADFVKNLCGETKVVMEATGNYYESIAHYLHEQNIFVSVVNPVLISDFGGNTLRRPKTDKKDSLKIASYALSYWVDLKEYVPQEDLRKSLKMLNRQYQQASKLKTMMNNNLISLLDLTFPEINKKFTSPSRESDGHEKWVDFVLTFPHCDMISKLTVKAFSKKYRKWCTGNSYHFTEASCEKIYEFSKECISSVSSAESTVFAVIQAARMLNSATENCHAIRLEMNRVAAQLPEYDTVMSMYGVGKAMGPQLIAEIGDPRRFHSRKAITAYFGYDSESNDSGQKVSKSNTMTKKGAGALRRTLFIIMQVLLQNKPADNPVYDFLIKKQSEGKHYYSYMNAAANKFLRIYYARVKEVLIAADTST